MVETIGELLDKEIRGWTNLAGEIVPFVENCDYCKKPSFRSLEDKRYNQNYCNECRTVGKRSDRWRQLCPPLYRTTTEESLVNIAKIPAEIVAEARRIVVETNKGLVLHGITGKGKTRLMYYAIKEWFKLHDDIREQLTYGWERDKRRYVLEASGLFGIKYGESLGNGKGSVFLEEHNNAVILFLDDLGNQKITERVAEALFLIIEDRMAHGRPTYITSNHVGAKLAARFEGDMGAAFARRIRESCEFLTW